ncbi:MAG: hypothetical protein AOA65_0053 [Candidatus Bathyarchaeota archaeon BA1]|nr:MAG: hypothetical protein AOA65_0053 [Candidatus Bathyarchaeota archaeon BA1]
MPLTPLHYAVAYLVHRWRRELSLPALIVSSMMPDADIVLTYFGTGGLQRRLLLHSLLAASTLGVLLSILLTIFLYPAVISPLFKLDRKMVEERCRFSSKLIVSCFIGCATHVFLDSLHHEFNPLLYPFLNESFDAFVLLNNWVYATTIIQSTFLTLSILILIREIGKGTENFWKRMLISAE